MIVPKNWNITAELTIRQTTKYIFTATFSEADQTTGNRRIIATAEGGSPETAFCRLLAELDKPDPDYDPADYGDYDWAKPDCML